MLAKKNIRLIFGAELNNPTTMEFTQYLGFLAFLTVFTIGFWLLLFLAGFVGYWLTGATVELIKEKKAEKRNKDN